MAQTPTTAPATEAQEVTTWEEAPYYEVTLGLGKAYRYHEKLQSFYQQWNDWILVANSVLSAGAFVSLIGGNSGTVVKLCIGIVAVCSAITSALAFPRKSKLHDTLRRRYGELSAKIEEWPANAANFAKAKAARKRIELDAPPVKRLVDLEANNEAMRAMGYPESALLPLSWTQRRFGILATFGLRRIEKAKAEQERLAAPSA